MKGAIIGDIAGSAYEFNPVKRKDIDLFPPDAKYTDDTVLTIAVAEAIINKRPYMDAIIEWGRKYPDLSYGTRFIQFLRSPDPKPYNSFGNGSAMRVSPVGWAFNKPEEVLNQAKKTAIVSHDHPEGIKGAQSIAFLIYMSKEGSSKEEMMKYIDYHTGYDIDRSLDEIRETYSFNETCQETVPEAIIAFLESEDFEDAIRNAISLGGDADTLAAITGSIAEAYYGVPQHLWEKAQNYLDDEMKEIIEIFYDQWIK